MFNVGFVLGKTKNGGNILFCVPSHLLIPIRKKHWSLRLHSSQWFPSFVMHYTSGRNNSSTKDILPLYSNVYVST